MTIKAIDMVAAARETLGTPYGLQARICGLKIDCAGVPVYAAQKHGIPLEDYTAYGRLPIPQEMRAQLDRNMVRVPKADMRIADVAWIRMLRDGEPQHLAMVGDYPLGGFTLIHAYNHCGLNKVVEHRMDDQWLARIVGVWRFRGVEA